MKKSILLTLLLGVFIVALPAMASPIQKGALLSSFYLGGTFGLEHSGMHFDNRSLAWGRAGVEVGLSGIYFLNDYFGLGGSLHYAGYQGSDKNYWNRETIPYTQKEMTLNTEFFNFMLMGRVNFNPHAPTRFYAPFGTGVSIGHAKFKYRDTTYDTSLSASSTSADLGAFAGLGVEYDMYEGALTVGLETRYAIYRYNIGRLAERVQADNHPGKETYSALSLLFVASFQ